jgi:hypothetical protein
VQASGGRAIRGPTTFAGENLPAAAGDDEAAKGLDLVGTSFRESRGKSHQTCNLSGRDRQCRRHRVVLARREFVAPAGEFDRVNNDDVDDPKRAADVISKKMKELLDRSDS